MPLSARLRLGTSRACRSVYRGADFQNQESWALGTPQLRPTSKLQDGSAASKSHARSLPPSTFPSSKTPVFRPPYPCTMGSLSTTQPQTQEIFPCPKLPSQSSSSCPRAFCCICSPSDLSACPAALTHSSLAAATRLSSFSPQTHNTDLQQAVRSVNS